MSTKGKLLDVTATAELLGLSAYALRAGISRGQAPHQRWGSRILFRRQVLNEYLKKLPGVSLEEVLQRVK